MIKTNTLALGPSKKRCQIRNLKDPIFGTRRNKEQGIILGCLDQELNEGGSRKFWLDENSDQGLSTR